MSTLLRLAGGLLGTGLIGWLGYGGAVYFQSEAAWDALCADVPPVGGARQGRAPARDKSIQAGKPIEEAAAAYIRDHGSRSDAIQALVDAHGGSASQRTDLLRARGAKEALATLRRCMAQEGNALGADLPTVAADLPKLMAGAILKDLALLEAQEQLDAGQDAEALRLFAAVLRLAKDHGELPLLITHAIGHSIATWALQGVQGRSFDPGQFGAHERNGLRDALVDIEPTFGPTIEILRTEAQMFRASVASQERPGTLAGMLHAMTHPGETHEAVQCLTAYQQVLSLAEVLATTGPHDFPSLDAELTKLDEQMPRGFSTASSTRSILREDARTQTLIRAWINALALDAGDAAPFPHDAFGEPFQLNVQPGAITIRTASETSPANNDRPITVCLQRSR